MNMYRRYRVVCIATLAACCIAWGSKALAQAKLDKTQLEQVELAEAGKRGHH
jgi:hypothetical protein